MTSAPGRPRHLAQLAPDLLEELAGAGALLLLLRRRGGVGGLRCWACCPLGLAVGAERALLLQHPLLRSVHGHGTVGAPVSVAGGERAGQEGLEPPTCGFGDRCSAS